MKHVSSCGTLPASCNSYCNNVRITGSVAKSTVITHVPPSASDGKSNPSRHPTIKRSPRISVAKCATTKFFGLSQTSAGCYLRLLICLRAQTSRDARASIVSRSHTIRARSSGTTMLQSIHPPELPMRFAPRRRHVQHTSPSPGSSRIRHLANYESDPDMA